MCNVNVMKIKQQKNHINYFKGIKLTTIHVVVCIVPAAHKNFNTTLHTS